MNAKMKLSIRSADWFVRMSYVVLTMATAFFVWDMFQEYSAGVLSGKTLLGVLSRSTLQDYSQNSGSILKSNWRSIWNPFWIAWGPLEPSGKRLSNLEAFGTILIPA